VGKIMAESKVVIKINYDRDSQSYKAPAVPQSLTVWRVDRILLAVTVLVLLMAVFTLLLFKVFKANDVVEKSVIPQALNDINNPNLNADQNKVENKFATVGQIDIHQEAKKIEPSIQKMRSTSGIIFNKKVIRASLNTIIKDNEPYGQVNGPIKLVKNETIQLFYFNQLREIRDKVLFHIWLKDGKVFLKKSLPIKNSFTIVSSEKIMTEKDIGNWQIQLQDANGKVYSELSFIIYTE
jgi:hypothetical protein